MTRFLERTLIAGLLAAVIVLAAGSVAGAGVLSGWTKEGSRPVFSVVTGTSTGALIAPYTFLGADYDDRLQQDYTTVTAADIFELRATRESMFDDWPFASLIAKIVTPVAPSKKDSGAT